MISSALTGTVFGQFIQWNRGGTGHTGRYSWRFL